MSTGKYYDPDFTRLRIQKFLDEEISSMWEGLIYEGICVAAAKEWFAESDIFIQILRKLEEEN